ncbi:flagellar biosynthetic protein FliO [Pimelobacter simplex]|uniref:flagellar biosynthetic protein FliO n=1 Tax=Nocardioides simplex TaxID=2045 RepID=UPI00382C96CF
MSGADTDLGALAFRLVGSLVLVVGLLLLIARLVNRRFKAPTGAAIQVVHRQALGRGQAVAVVSVGTRVLVLGTTEQQVTLLTEVEPDEIGLDLDATTLDGGAVEPPRHKQPAATGPLAGSVLSPQTWKQTLAAVTGQSDSAPPRRRAS